MHLAPLILRLTLLDLIGLLPGVHIVVCIVTSPEPKSSLTPRFCVQDTKVCSEVIVVSYCLVLTDHMMNFLVSCGAWQGLALLISFWIELPRSSNNHLIVS